MLSQPWNQAKKDNKANQKTR